MIEVSGFNTLIVLLVIMSGITSYSVYKFKYGGHGVIATLWVPLVFFDTALILALVLSFVRFI